MIGIVEFITLVFVGALCSLDTVSVAQAMISRPIVSSTLGGAVLGQAPEGLVVGAVMELFALETLPFGASRYPEWGAAGVAAAATYVIGGTGSPGSLAFAVLVGLTVAGLGSLSMVLLRRAIGRVAGEFRDELAGGSSSAVMQLHVTGIAADFWRGIIVSAVGVFIAFLATESVLARWNVAFGPSLAWPLILATAVGVGAITRCARPLGALGYLGVGVAFGAVVLAVSG